MKKLILSCLAAISLISFNSCSEDFQVSAPYKNITIVYGLIDMLDTAHYVRIQKAFLDENKSAFDMAKEADSNFYQFLDVKVKEMSGNTVISTTTLEKVDMNNEGYPKDTGTFFQGPNYGYKFKKTLSPIYTYRLIISNSQTGNVDSSEISIIDATSMQLVGTDKLEYDIAFTRTVPTTTAIFQLPYKVPSTAKYVEGMMRFHWVDKNISTGEQTDHSAEYIFDSREVDNKKMLVTPNVQFYSFLRDAMLSAPPNIERYMDSTDLYIFAAGSDLYNYLVTTQTQAGGITADQLKPTFTNIRGKNVYGLFAARTYKAKFNIPLNPITIDSLKVSQITAPLNIKGVSDH